MPPPKPPPGRRGRSGFKPTALPSLRLLLLLPPILAGAAFSASSQPTSVVLPVRQARRLADSLAVLPLVRREAAAWQHASRQYAAAADSFAQAATRYQHALHT